MAGASPSWNQEELPQQRTATAPLPAQLFRPQPPTAAAPASTAAPAATAAPAKLLPELFFGNIPLNPHLASKIDEDKIATAFHNSTRKTLNFIPPSVQNGEVIVRPSIDMIRAGSHRWNTTAVGYFLGKKPYFHHLNEFVRSIWPGVRDVKGTSNGFFFFQFETIAAMEDVIEGGRWLYLGQPIVLQKWEPGMVLRELKHTEVPVWIKLRHLPVELWTTEGLSTVASGIGRPLYPDAIRRACTRWDFARVCIMLNVNSKLPKHVVIMMPNELGGESACKVDVEKSMPITPAAPELKLREQVQADPVLEKNTTKTEVDRVCEDMSGHGRDKAIWNVWGLNRRDHQVAVRDLVCEFRLHFIALLETRVLQSNVTRIQSGVLSRWRWFVDYAGPGNRIWIAWNDELIEVDILNVGSQFVHCPVLVHEVHETILITVVYGANDVSTRRELWQGLIDLAVTIGNEPWLVGGDFNAVLDMSEVSGASGDIRVAMNEFNDCILQIGLLSLPMQDGRTCIIHASHLVHRITPMVLKGDCRNMQHPVVGTPMYSVTRKLKALKPVFRQQRRCKGDLAMNVKLAAGFLEIMLRQRAKIQWLKGFIGGDRTDRAIDLRYLRPWARHVLTDDEAWAIIRPVTIEEVKTAFFDIEEDKAPGQDGFSSGFFKAAWPVVGEEVSKAIIDFFKTGRLLKQLNATLLTLIPAVDLRKAYDTVEWDFLIATLRMFGFPALFIRWIEECVTSAHYSVVVNGGQLIEQDGEFQYHWRCQELKLFQLSFADVLLCKADERSVNLFCRGLDRFATHSSLHTNPQKSQLIISKAASGLRDSLLATLGSGGPPSGQIPRSPTYFSMAFYADCQPLLQKYDSRIKGWEGVQLSFAGWVQLIKSVLISFEVYWAMAFILPKGIIKEMIKRLPTFLWKGPDLYFGKLDHPGSTSGLSIWTVKENKGAWGWRKMLSLRHYLRSHIQYSVGNGDSILLWHDLWHPLGPLISRFPRGPQLTRTRLLDKLSVGPDRISWKSKDGSFKTSTAYDLSTHQDPRCSGPLLMGSFKIPKNCFILWLLSWGDCLHWINHGFTILEGLAFCAWIDSLRHMITFSFHAPFPAVALPLSDSRSHFHGPAGIGNLGFNGRHPDGVVSMWLMQHIDLYWLQLSTTSGRNAIQGACNSVADHPRLWAGLLWRRLDRGSLVSFTTFCFLTWSL
ncbi:hypothetical protein Sango_2744000 [Sesamum angolense]|uniref:DUF4283 domain-containing protein n=1 Tax=Sesamum angolense TaxID=2727404 RepID=A0AAE1W081_9LAMI|nr:hypothetical protein Sango_2744000 [Sesamum angolense]